MLAMDFVNVVTKSSWSIFVAILVLDMITLLLENIVFAWQNLVFNTMMLVFIKTQDPASVSGKAKLEAGVQTSFKFCNCVVMTQSLKKR